MANLKPVMLGTLEENFSINRTGSKGEIIQMSSRNSLNSYKLRSVFELFRRCRSSFTGKQPCERCHAAPVAKHRYDFPIQRGLQTIGANGETSKNSDATMKDDDKINVPQPMPQPPRKAEMVAEEVENAAKVVEKLATATEKVSAELADKLPENSKLKEATLVIEHVSNAVAKDAKATEDFIHKVDVLKQDLEDLETMIEPVINKIVEKESGSK